jgi:spore coat protein H
MTTLNINKHSEDVMKVSTKLCTDLLADIPDIASFRTHFMRVWIRDYSLPVEEQVYEYYGLYTNIEQPNKSYLEARSLPSDCVMYKARSFSFRLEDSLLNVDDPEYDELAFEEVLTIREGEDHTKLLEMLEEVNDETTDFQTVFDTYFNEDNFLTWLTFNILIGNDDIINHNYIVYSPQNANTWYFIPWDFDGAMYYGEYVSDIMLLPESLRGGQKLNQNVICSKYFRLPGSIDKIQDKMEEMLQMYMDEGKVSSLLDSYLPVLEETMIYEPDLGLLEMEPSELEAYMLGISDFMETNYEEFLYASQFPAPMYLGMPEKQEDGSVYFSWEPSYSYQERTITYNIKVADDYNMNQIIFEDEGLVSPDYIYDGQLSSGTYYLSVTAVDSAGNEQLNMERYETKRFDGGDIYVNGVLEFKID